MVLFHDGDDRCLHVGGKDSPDYDAVAAQGRKEQAERRQSVDLRRDDPRTVTSGGLVGTGLRRAERRVVAAVAGPRAGRVGGARSLRAREDLGRRRHGAAAEVGGCGRAGDRGVGGACPRQRSTGDAEDVDFEVRHFHRAIDTAWRRTSYSGLIRVAETSWGQQRAGSRRAGRRGRRDSLGGEGVRAGRTVADGGSADGCEVRHPGACGVGDGGSVRDRSACRVGVADPRAFGVVAGGRRAVRTGSGAGADARHSAWARWPTV